MIRKVARLGQPVLRFWATRASSDYGSTPELRESLESIGTDATSSRQWKGLYSIRDPPRAAMQG